MSLYNYTGEIIKFDISDINAYVTPQQFGAKGDGATDDTVAFQEAINTGKNVIVPLTEGQKYVITDTLICPYFHQSIYGDVINPDWGIGDYSIYFNASNKVLFDFKSGMVGCANLSIHSSNRTNTAIRFKKDTDKTNIDASVINCSFRNWDTAIDHYGRGLTVKRNVFFDCRVAVKTTLVNEPRWDKSSPNVDEIIQTYPEYNGRSLYIVDNRFHVIFERYLLVVSEDYTSDDTALKQVLNGAIITGNMADIGRGSFEFKAPIKGCIFSDNEFLMVNQDTFFDCQEGACGCSIADNTIRGVTDAKYPSYSTLNLYGKDCFAFNGLESTSITGNVVENFKQRCIYCYGDGLNDSTIIGNVFKNYGFDTSATQYERAGIDVPDSENSIVTNNTFVTDSDFDGYMIRARDVSSNVWKGNVFSGNARTKRTSVEILVPTTTETEDNIIQGAS